MDKKKLDEFVKKVEDNSNEILEDSLLDKEASMEDTRGFTYDDIVKISTRDKMSKLPWLIAIFLILTISLIVGYMFFRYNPQTIFTNTVDNFFSFITSNNFDNSYDITKGNIKIVMDDGTSLNASYTLDNANGLSKYVLDGSGGKVTLYNDGKNLYFQSKDVYDGFLKFSSNTNIDNIKFSDMKIILNGVNQAFDKVTTTEKIMGGKTNYDLGNKTIKVYESKLVIDSKNYKRVAETFISSLKSNEEFVATLSKMFNLKDVKGNIDKFSLSLSDYLKDNSDIEFKIYTDRFNNNFLRGEIKSKDSLIVIIKNGDSDVSVNIDSPDLKGNFDLKSNSKREKTSLSFDLSGEINKKGDVVITSKKADSFGKMKMDDVLDVSNLPVQDASEINTKIIQNPYFEKLLKWLF